MWYLWWENTSRFDHEPYFGSDLFFLLHNVSQNHFCSWLDSLQVNRKREISIIGGIGLLRGPRQLFPFSRGSYTVRSTGRLGQTPPSPSPLPAPPQHPLEIMLPSKSLRYQQYSMYKLSKFAFSYMYLYCCKICIVLPAFLLFFWYFWFWLQSVRRENQ